MGDTTTPAAFEVVRALPDPVRADAAADGAEGLGRMTVRFSALGNWYEIRSVWEGHFLERIAPGAFKKTIAENRANMRVLFNHGFDPTVGQKVLGEIADVREGSDAAVGEVDLFDTSYTRDLLPGLKRGVYGASMRMVVTRDEINSDPGVSEHNPQGIPERTIKEVRLSEFGPVTFPANPSTSATARSSDDLADVFSMTDEFYERMRSVDPGWVDEVARSIQTTPPAADAGSSTSAADGAGTQDRDAPGSTHPSGLTPGQRRRSLNHLTEGAAS